MAASAAKVVQLSERVRRPHRVTEPRMRSKPDEGKIVAKRLSDIPRNQRACRVRHPWPTETELEYDRPLPSSVRVTVVNGREVLEETCPRCGKTRRQDMLSGRTIDPHAGYDYTNPKDWVTAGENLDAGRRACRHDLINSVLRAGS